MRAFMLPLTKPTIIPIAMQTLAVTLKNHAVLDKDTLAAVRLFQALIVDKYPTDGLIVYGSRARGTHRKDSDADVAVLLAGEHQRFVTTKLAMADIAYDVLLETGIDISPLPIWRDEWEHPEGYSNPELLRNIAREGISL